MAPSPEAKKPPSDGESDEPDPHHQDRECNEPHACITAHRGNNGHRKSGYQHQDPDYPGDATKCRASFIVLLGWFHVSLAFS